MVLPDSSGHAILRRGSATARLLGPRVQIPPGAWMSGVVCCQVEVPARADYSPECVLLSVIVKPG